MVFRFHSYTKLIILSTILLVGGVGYYIVCVEFADVWQMLSQLPFKQKEFEVIVNDYRSGKLIAVDNAIEVPTSSRELVVWDKIYITKNTDWGDALLFCMWEGRGTDLKGYVFFTNIADATKPMPASLELVSQHPQREVANTTDGDVVATYTTKAALVREIDVIRTEAPGWFYVCRLLD